MAPALQAWGGVVYSHVCACTCVHVCVRACEAVGAPALWLRSRLTVLTCFSCWRLWRQLLRLAPGLRCGRLNFLPWPLAAAGCLRQGLPLRCSSGGSPPSCRGCLRGGPGCWGRGFCVGWGWRALLWSPASYRELLTGRGFKLSPPPRPDTHLVEFFLLSAYV